VVVLPISFSLNYSAFEYSENGYISTVSCVRNTSSAFTMSKISQTKTQDRRSSISVWIANGTLPNSPPDTIEEYVIAPIGGGANYFVWSAVVNDDVEENRYMLAVAAEGWYAPSFNKMQCTIGFVPSAFNVLVNKTSQTIEVSPISNATSPTMDIEPTGNLSTSVVLGLNVLSQVAGNSVVSVLGNAIQFNLANVGAQNPDFSREEVYVRGLQDSITIILDDLLGSFAAVQILSMNASTTVPLTAHYKATRIGSDKYIFAILGINIVILFLVVVEAMRTHLWVKMTDFNFTDIKCVIVAASSGGHAISETCIARCKILSTRWKGNADKEVFKTVLVKLVESKEGAALVGSGFEDELKSSASPLYELDFPWDGYNESFAESR
jgi:hypothetical protein